MMKSKSEYTSAARTIALDIACDALRDAINRRSAIKRANDTFYNVKRPAYVDGVILHERKGK